MREILFRGKDAAGGRWLYGYYLTFNVPTKDYLGHFIWSGNYKEEVCPNTVGQYTGLRDKNGKKIFEGDIVMLPDKKDPYSVEWEDDTAKFVLYADGLCADLDNYCGRELEIVGDVYGNMN